MRPEDEATLRRLEALPDPDLTDPDNPEWTEEDFRRARPAEDYPDVLAAFARAREARPR